VHRRLAPALLLLLLVTSCSEVRDTTDGVSGRISGAADCVGLARDVAATRLSGTPTAQDADEAVRRLDDRVRQMDDGELKTATSTLRDRLREVADAARRGDAGAAQAAGEGARDAARETARICRLPIDQFV
jgi:hypothetical protein